MTRLSSTKLSALVPFLFLAACGYVGPVLPPSPEIPATITNLAAVQRGDQVLITFTAPPRTTDGSPIRQFSAIELQVNQAKSYSIDLPPPSDSEDPQPKPIGYSLPVSDFNGQHIALAVRSAVKKAGHYSAWSRAVQIEVIPPLQPPVIQAESSAAGIVLTWAASDDAQYQIQRQSPADKQPIELATVNEPRYVDVSAQYDTAYRYIVTARKGTAESLPSEPRVFSAKDIYAPATPSRLTAVAGPDAVDLAWQRNAEPDFKGYYIYRSTNNAPFERQGDSISLPEYTDRNVEHGKTYSYKISAVDKNGNESPQCNPAETQY